MTWDYCNALVSRLSCVSLTAVINAARKPRRTANRCRLLLNSNPRFRQSCFLLGGTLEVYVAQVRNQCQP